MDFRQFDKVLEKQLDRVKEVLSSKAVEYSADEDRLSNFKTAAALQGVPLSEALRGMMVKHTVSIYDMIGSRQTYSIDQWDEKITDHINYLILLRAVIIEESGAD